MIYTLIGKIVVILFIIILLFLLLAVIGFFLEYLNLRTQKFWNEHETLGLIFAICYYSFILLFLIIGIWVLLP
jgi:hypothetical protein